MKMKNSTTLTIIFSIALLLGIAIPKAHALELLTYWDFNDPSDATSAADVTGNTPDLGFNGNAAYTEDGGGLSDSAGDYALDLGGVNDGSYGQTSEGEHLNSAFDNNAMSVAFWQNTTQIGNTSSFWIHSPDATGGQRGFQAHTPWGNGTIFFDQSGCCEGTQRLTVGGLVQLNTWQHFVFQRDVDGNMEIWVDGVQAASQGGAEPLDAFNGIISIGCEGPTTANSFAGRIDDFGIFNEVLDEDQIATLAGGSSPMALIDTSDDDEDGLPDIWEESLVDNLDDLNGNGAGPGPGSGTGDFDGDGLTDLDEYEETKTNPIVADTDGDGLVDGVETGTGTYVSATNTGTDPKNADSDGDGLVDGVETNSGILIDEEDTGTDPNNADTDGDSYGDGGELAGGTDPHDPNSKGAIPAPFLYVDFEADAEDLSENGYNGEVDGLVSFDVEGAEGGPTPMTGANFTGGHIDFPDIDMNLMIRDFEDGSYTFACWLKPIGSAGGEGFMWGQTNQGIHNGIRNGGLLHSAHWGADWNASTVLEAEQWVHAAWVYDGVTDTATIYLNGEIDGGPQAQRAANGDGTFLFGGRNNGEIPYNGYVDDVTIWRSALPQGNIMALAEGASPIGVGGPGASYSQNFDGFDDGTTDLEDGSVMTGAAASVQDGRLQLTIDQQGLGFSSFSVPALPGSSQGFTVSFDYELYDSLGANDPADGFSFNYGDAPLGDQGQAEEGMVTRPGVTENISWEVDTWRNGDAEQGVNISGLAGGADLGELDFTNGIILEDDSRKTGTMEISWNPAVGASFTTTGLTTNADFSNVDTGAFVADDEHSFIISARVGGANEDLFIDNLVITVDSTDDADRDGLPDFWEEKYGVDDPEGDPDNDGLTNIEELEARTKPDTADTDEDGLNDGDEINVTETNPKKADSDNDGLLDGVETNTGSFVSKDDTGTDPNNADTDDDGFRDSIEVAQGSDPSDKNSFPDIPVITLLGVGTGALLQNDLTDPENDGVEGPTDPGPPQTAGTDFNWISINASEENYFSGQGLGNEGAFDLFDNTTGGGVNKWCCGGAPQWVTVEFEEPVSISHFVIAASNDMIGHNRAPLDWGIYGSNDGESFEPIFEQSDDEPIWKADLEVYLFDLPRPSDPYTFIKYDVTRTNGGAHEIGEIEYFGEVGAGALNEIVEINYEKDTENIELTWNSRPGKTYGIFYSLNLEEFDADVDDGIIGEEGETTSYSFENPEPGVPKIFFRVMVMEE
jgi:hypothetical protein